MFVPRPARIFHRTTGTALSDHLPQTLHLGIEGVVGDRAYVLLQMTHMFKAAEGNFRVMVRGDIKPWVAATGEVRDKIGEGFAELLDWMIDVVV